MKLAKDTNTSLKSSPQNFILSISETTTAPAAAMLTIDSTRAPLQISHQDYIFDIALATAEHVDLAAERIEAAAESLDTAAAAMRLVAKELSKLSKLYWQIIAGISIFLLVALTTIVLVRVIIRPIKPKLILQDATVYAFKVSSPNLITCNFQVTLSTRNPKDNIGVYYDKTDVYATYGNQEITCRTAIPATYQGHNGINVWSSFVYGTNVPVAPYNAVSLRQDQINGVVPLMFKIDGRVRWKVGPFRGSYPLHVKCPANINFKNNQSGVVGENVVKYQLMQSCSVSV